jgi:hypothetical protein
VTILRRQAPIDRFFIDLDLARRGRYLLGCSPPLGLARSGRSEGSAVVGTLSIGTIRAADGVSSTGNGAFALELLNAPQELTDQSVTLVRRLLKILPWSAARQHRAPGATQLKALDTGCLERKVRSALFLDQVEHRTIECFALFGETAEGDSCCGSLVARDLANVVTQRRIQLKAAVVLQLDALVYEFFTLTRSSIIITIRRCDSSVTIDPEPAGLRQGKHHDTLFISNVHDRKVAPPSLQIAFRTIGSNLSR